MPNVSDKSTSGVAQVIMPKFALSDAILSAQVDTCILKFVTSYPEGVPNYQMYCNQRLYDNEWT